MSLALSDTRLVLLLAWMLVVACAVGCRREAPPQVAARVEVRAPTPPSSDTGRERFGAVNIATGRPVERPVVPSVKHACPCCANLTLSEAPGSYEICPVCFWEDDPAQSANPQLEGGANHVSLARARLNYASFGADSQDDRAHVRPPLPEELPPARAR